MSGNSLPQGTPCRNHFIFRLANNMSRSVKMQSLNQPTEPVQDAKSPETDGDTTASEEAVPLMPSPDSSSTNRSTQKCNKRIECLKPKMEQRDKTLSILHQTGQTNQLSSESELDETSESHDETDESSSTHGAKYNKPEDIVDSTTSDSETDEDDTETRSEASNDVVVKKRQAGKSPKNVHSDDEYQFAATKQKRKQQHKKTISNNALQLNTNDDEAEDLPEAVVRKKTQHHKTAKNMKRLVPKQRAKIRAHKFKKQIFVKSSNSDAESTEESEPIDLMKCQPQRKPKAKFLLSEDDEIESPQQAVKMRNRKSAKQNILESSDNETDCESKTVEELTDLNLEKGDKLKSSKRTLPAKELQSQESSNSQLAEHNSFSEYKKLEVAGLIDEMCAHCKEHFRNKTLANYEALESLESKPGSSQQSTMPPINFESKPSYKVLKFKNDVKINDGNANSRTKTSAGVLKDKATSPILDQAIDQISPFANKDNTVSRVITPISSQAKENLDPKDEISPKKPKAEATASITACQSEQMQFDEDKNVNVSMQSPLQQAITSQKYGNNAADDKNMSKVECVLETLLTECSSTSFCENTNALLGTTKKPKSSPTNIYTNNEVSKCNNVDQGTIISAPSAKCDDSTVEVIECTEEASIKKTPTVQIETLTLEHEAFPKVDKDKSKETIISKPEETTNKQKSSLLNQAADKAKEDIQKKIENVNKHTDSKTQQGQSPHAMKKSSTVNYQYEPPPNYNKHKSNLTEVPLVEEPVKENANCSSIWDSMVARKLPDERPDEITGSDLRQMAIWKRKHYGRQLKPNPSLDNGLAYCFCGLNLFVCNAMKANVERHERVLRKKTT